MNSKRQNKCNSANSKNTYLDWLPLILSALAILLSCYACYQTKISEEKVDSHNCFDVYNQKSNELSKSLLEFEYMAIKSWYHLGKNKQTSESYYGLMKASSNLKENLQSISTLHEKYKNQFKCSDEISSILKKLNVLASNFTNPTDSVLSSFNADKETLLIRNILNKKNLATECCAIQN